MKRMFALLGLIVALGSTEAVAQSRVGISVTFGDPHIAGHVVIGRPHYYRHGRPYYYGYHPGVVVLRPRVYRPARVVVVRPHRHHPRHHPRRYHR
jgi:hypothetical protein